MKFVKQKMIDRIKAEGREDMIDDEVMSIMDNLDGQECQRMCWRRVVLEEPVYWVVGKNGEGYYVNELDCE